MRKGTTGVAQSGGHAPLWGRRPGTCTRAAGTGNASAAVAVAGWLEKEKALALRRQRSLCPGVSLQQEGVTPQGRRDLSAPACSAGPTPATPRMLTRPRVPPAAAVCRGRAPWLRTPPRGGCSRAPPRRRRRPPTASQRTPAHPRSYSPHSCPFRNGTRRQRAWLRLGAKMLT